MTSTRSPRRAAALLALLALALVPLAAVRAQTPTPAANDAQALLTKAAATMAKVKSFHFELSTPRGKTQFRTFELQDVVGDVQRPDRFRATLTVVVAVATVQVQIVGIGNRLWVTNPLATGNQTPYQQVDVGSGLDQLLNPDKLLLQAVRYISNPKIAGTQDVAGTKATMIAGTVDLRQVTDLQGTPVPVERLGLPQTQVPTTVWIDDAGHVLAMQVAGPLVPGESNDVVRELDLSNFDEPVDIEPPTT